MPYKVVGRRSADVWLLTNDEGPHDHVQILDLSIRRLHPPVPSNVANESGPWEPVFGTVNVAELLRGVEVMPAPFDGPYVVYGGVAG